MSRDLPPTIQDLAELSNALRSTDALVGSGFPERGITAAARSGALIRLRRSTYVADSDWTSLTRADRHLTAMIAAQNVAQSPLVFSHRSAAALHGLPVWSAWLARVFGDPAAELADPRVVEVTVPARYGSGNELVIHHRGALENADITTRAGLTCTSPERTVIDLARTEPFGIALACTDALLRHQFRLGRALDIASWRRWQTQMLEQARSRSGHRGMAIVRALAELADPRSDSPLESVSRLRFHQLGIAVEVQAPVPAERGGMLYLDFRFPELSIFGECDGNVKYTEAELLAGETPTEVLLKEKKRHDWITSTSKMRGVRWGAADVTSTSGFAKKLAAFGIPTPGTPRPGFDRETAAILRRLP